MSETIEFLGIPLKVWSVLGTWVASIGTVGAVVVSLALAYNRFQPNLIIKIVRMSPVPDIGFVVGVANKGAMPVEISAIEWRSGRRKSLHYYKRGFIHNLPTILHSGKGEEFFLPANTLFKDKEAIFYDHKNDMDASAYTRVMLKSVKHLYIAVHVSASEQPIEIKVKDEKIKELIKMWHYQRGLIYAKIANTIEH